MSGLFKEVESIVLAMWDEDPEEIALEASSRLAISLDHAFDLVEEVILNEMRADQELENDFSEWDALVEEGFLEDDY